MTNIRDLINAMELPEGSPQLPPHLRGHRHDADILRGTLEAHASELHRIPEGWRVVPQTKVPSRRWPVVALAGLACVLVGWLK